MTKATTNVARVAAAVAGFGLVAMSFAPLAGAQTTTTTTTSTTSTVTFTRDLTVGSTGADVTALQTWLIAKGFSIPAGATGYFGAQTTAAVAAYQAANAITPAAGYFGPITRAKVNAAGGATGTTTVPGCSAGYAFSPVNGQPCTTGSTGGSTSTGSLSGGEADLRNFDLLAEDGSGAEGDTDVKAATAEFDVDGGDISIQRAELTVHATDDAKGDRPWDYIDSVSVWDGSTKLGDVNADSRNDWDEEDSDDFSGGSDSQYTITLDDLNDVIEDGDTADLTFAFDINDNIDTSDLSQDFDIAVLDDGIRAVDAAGIQQYVGDDKDNVNFGFDEEDNGDLSLRSNSDNPDDGILVADDSDTSDEMDVLVGDLRNKGDNDSLITDMTFRVATSSGVTANLSDVVRRATLDIDGDTYRGDVNDDGTIDFDDIDTTVDSDDTATFTLSVEVAPVPSNGSGALAEGDTLQFNLSGTDIDAEGADSGDDTDVSGSLTGSVFTVSTTGVDVNGSSANANVTTLDTVDSSYGTYTIKFDVTAGDDDIYVPTGAGTTSASTFGTASTTGAMFDITGGFTGTTTGSFSSTADTDGATSHKGDFYVVRAGDTETFTLSVTLNPTASGTYEVDMTGLRYASDLYGTLTTFNTDGDADFQTDPAYIPS